jgi:hypothetical protein
MTLKIILKRIGSRNRDDQYWEEADKYESLPALLRGTMADLMFSVRKAGMNMARNGTPGSTL